MCLDQTSPSETLSGLKKKEIRQFAEYCIRLAENASRLTGIEKSAIVVYLREATPEDVGVGGELLEDVLKRKG